MIEVTHQLTVEAECPMDDNVTDLYDVTVRVRHALPVEEIIAAKNALPKRPMFQEELTEILASQHLNGCEVTTRGVHSGVVTTVRSGVLR